MFPDKNFENVSELSPGTLAFVGDAVYGLFVRTLLAGVNRPAGELHKMSLEYVAAPMQAQAFKKIAPLLTETEHDIFRRGRNLHVNNVPKSATPAQYHTATGLECLFGFLYLSGNTDRAKELFAVISETE